MSVNREDMRRLMRRGIWHGAVAAIVGVMLIAGPGHAQMQDLPANGDCAGLFAQYGFETYDPDGGEVRDWLAEDLLTTELFAGEPCRAASLVADIDAIAAAGPVDLSGDITGVYINENALLTASGALAPGFEILDIEHFYAGFIFSQYMIGSASLPDTRGQVFFPIRISRLRTRLDETGQVIHDPTLSAIRYYADPIAEERAQDLAWKRALNYWDGTVFLRQGPDDKLVLGFEPRGAQAAIFSDTAAMGQASLRPTDWDSLGIAQRMMAAGRVDLSYFPCVLRKVEQRFADETISWPAALEALAQSEALAEEERVLMRRLRGATVLGRETDDLSAPQQALQERRAAFERTANGQLFASLVEQNFNCLALPQIAAE